LRPAVEFLSATAWPSVNCSSTTVRRSAPPRTPSSAASWVSATCARHPQAAPRLTAAGHLSAARSIGSDAGIRWPSWTPHLRCSAPRPTACCDSSSAADACPGPTAGLPPTLQNRTDARVTPEDAARLPARPACVSYADGVVPHAMGSSGARLEPKASTLGSAARRYVCQPACGVRRCPASQSCCGFQRILYRPYPVQRRSAGARLVRRVTRRSQHPALADFRAAQVRGRRPRSSRRATGP
jgi:hypothetical protein